MHKQNFDLTIEEISKIEGHAALDIKVKDGAISDLKLKLADYKRFYTKAVEGKSIAGVPQQVARICGTCSNAHLLASIKTIEKAIGLQASEQTEKLRELLNYGLIIRDHALHLYIFVLPDLLGRDSILDFDEKNEKEHKLLHDAFAVKEAGNLLSIWAGGRSVHAPYAGLGGFTKLPDAGADKIIENLQNIRPKILYLIPFFAESKSFAQEDIVFAALDDPFFSFLSGDIITSDKQKIPQEEFYQSLTHIERFYSQASAYKLKDKVIMVGALARVNLLKERLHKNTQEDASRVLRLFPSKNIFHNNLAQAIEILHSIDRAIALLSSFKIIKEKPVQIFPKKAIGKSLTEAPRGLLYHEYDIDSAGKVSSAKIVVPTGFNQILMEQSLKNYLKDKLSLQKDKIGFEAEKLIRAYDPCISCATHFLKLIISS